ncbi:MAG: DUF5672 family protein [bacterium]
MVIENFKMSELLKSLVAVIIPVHRIPLTADEYVSLRVIRNILAAYPRIIVCPESLEIPVEFFAGEEVIRLPDIYFTYPHGYNRLMLSRRFYEQFKKYTYILIYQLDCLVFKDELLEWCRKGYDYIGSPWKDSYPSGDVTWKVGNGGFSLRKVSTALNILKKRIKRGLYYPMPPADHIVSSFTKWLAENIANRMKQHLNFWTIEDELANYVENEDRFWAIDVMAISSEYKKPSVIEAMHFGFEVELEYCLQMTGGKLPFGCHAWAKHDRSFWESVLGQLKSAPQK